MQRLNLYINAVGFITHAGHSGQDSFTFQETLPEPDYTAFMSPMQQRRMSRAVRMGIGAARMCLQSLPELQVDAISVGTALGCLNDTAFFLGKMISQDEQMLTPTAFIQSTHNTVAGQIALQLGCHGHNLTFVHKAHSFIHALVDATLYLHQHPSHHVLVGGIDESTPLTQGLMQRSGQTLNAEGAAFFVLSAQRQAHTIACLQAVSTSVKERLGEGEIFTASQIQSWVGSYPTADAGGLALMLAQGHRTFELQHSFCGMESCIAVTA